MTTLVLSALVDRTPGLLRRLADYWNDFVTGIEEARAMAALYRDLAGMSETELAARGLKREDIPRAVIGASDRT
jgi:hypothetical protein